MWSRGSSTRKKIGALKAKPLRWQGFTHMIGSKCCGLLFLDLPRTLIGWNRNRATIDHLGISHNAPYWRLRLSCRLRIRKVQVPIYWLPIKMHYGMMRKWSIAADKRHRYWSKSIWELCVIFKTSPSRIAYRSQSNKNLFSFLFFFHSSYQPSKG